MVFECKRCLYSTAHLKDIKSHLSRKFPCPSLHSSIPPEQLLGDIITTLQLQNVKKYKCRHCEKSYSSPQSRWLHVQQKHPTPVGVDTSRVEDNRQDQVADLKAEVAALRKTVQNLMVREPDVQNAESIIVSISVVRNEEYYQRVLESVLQGTHKKLPCGITDITTPEFHAEIKNWKSWKEAIGQLLCYNHDDPRPSMRMYMFGKASPPLMRNVSAQAREHSINLYMITDVANGIEVTHCETDICERVIVNVNNTVHGQN